MLEDPYEKQDSDGLKNINWIIEAFGLLGVVLLCALVVGAIMGALLALLQKGAA